MENNRAYSLLTVKAVDEEKRIIRGMATTPEPDRVGDVVDPMGASFGNNLPLLWMHRHDSPVGTVNFGKATKDGIPFEAKLPVVLEPSQLKARIDEAWQSVKAGLVRAVSIGFRPLEYTIMEDTGGYRFTRSEIYELSLVTVPANAGATITEIKSLDAEVRAALGKKQAEAEEKPASGVTDKKTKTVKLTPKEGKTTMNLAEQIKQFQNERAAKAAQMEELMKKSADSGETLDDADAAAFDELEAEVTSIDKQLDRLKKLEKAKMATATPVVEKAGQDDPAATAARQNIRVTVKQELPKGVAFARLAKCKALSKMQQVPAYEMAEALYPDDQRISRILKAAVAAGTTTQATWAAPLVGEESSVFADFVEFLRPQTILGKFGNNGVPSLRNVPFRTRLVGQTSGGAAYWTGEGAAKGVTKFDFTDTTLAPLKVANIAVITMELLRDSSPNAEMLVRDGLAAAIRERLDIDFINPDKTASAGVSPASITNGVTPIPSIGGTAEDIRCDIQALLGTYIAANNPPTTGVLVMSATTALAASMLRNPLGQAEFPNLTMNGGTLEGFPVIVSEYIQPDTTGSYVVMVNASDIYLGDEGGINIDMSDQASLQMDTAPTNNGTGTPTATQLVSLWQDNLVGFRAERTINWARRRTSAVALLTGVNWGVCS